MARRWHVGDAATPFRYVLLVIVCKCLYQLPAVCGSPAFTLREMPPDGAAGLAPSRHYITYYSRLRIGW